MQQDLNQGNFDCWDLAALTMEISFCYFYFFLFYWFLTPVCTPLVRRSQILPELVQDQQKDQVPSCRELVCWLRELEVQRDIQLSGCLFRA